MANNNETTLEMLNSANFRLNQPAFVLLTLLLPVGIVANVLALYIFTWREARSNRRIFLLFLTFIDLVCCILGVPLVMIDLTLPVMHPSGVLCKMQRFVLHFCNISCLFTLLLIAVERYNAVCRPLGRQMNLFQTKKLILAVVGIALFLALPVSLVADTIKFQLVTNVDFYICWFEFPLHWDVYVWTVFAIFWVSLIVMFTFHCLVCKSMRGPVGQDEEAEQVAVRERTKQISRTLVGVSFLCAASLSPYMILNSISWPGQSDSSESWQTFKLFLIHLWITNCTGKPVVFAIFDTKFRGQLKSIFRKIKKSDDPESETPKETED